MENEIRELLKEQRLRATQQSERRKLENLRLLEIQEALKSRDDVTFSVIGSSVLPGCCVLYWDINLALFYWRGKEYGSFCCMKLFAIYVDIDWSIKL